MNYQKRRNKQAKLPPQSDTTGAKPAGPRDTATTAPSGGADTYQRVLRYANSGNYQKALDLLRTAGRHPQMRNALGVCLLRLGRIEDATRIYRELVLSAGCTWVRPDAPAVHKINFATALLLSGHPAGCVEILSEVKDDSHPAVQRLRRAIKDWQAALPLWKRLNWRFGNIEPKGFPVTLDFAPGEFELDLSLPETSPPKGSDPSLRTAV